MQHVMYIHNSVPSLCPLCSYGDIELIADHGTSNSGDGIDLPHSDSNAIINATGGATPSDHSGTSPTSPQLYSEANSGKVCNLQMKQLSLSLLHVFL